MIALQALQTGIERRRDQRADAGPLGREPHFGRDDHVRLQRGQHAAEIFLRGAVAIRRRGVEKIDPGLERTRNRALLIRRAPARHQPADRAATEGQYRNVKSGAAEFSCVHAGKRSANVGLRGSRLTYVE